MISPEVLRRYPYFTGASEETLKTLAMVGEEENFPEGTTMFKDGEPANALYILITGEVDIQLALHSGERRTVDTLVSGDLLVWSAVVEPYRTTAYGVTREDTDVLTFDADTLRELVERDREFGYSLMKEVARVTSHRLQGARVQLATHV